MRFLTGALLALVVMTGTASAQPWIEYTDREELFFVNLPEQPKVEDVMMETEYGAMVPGKKYTANRGDNHFTVTVWNYADAEVTDVRGSVAFAAHNFRVREKGGEITYDAYAQIDRIEGHQLQFTRPDGRRVFIAMHLHKSRLYILDADVVKGQPPPILFQASLQILDADGNRVRYNLDADGVKTPVRGGRPDAL